MMKKNKLFILFTVVFLMHVLTWAGPWPRINLIIGNPVILSNLDHKKINLKKGDYIKTSFTVKTGVNDLIKIDLGDEGQIIIFSNSELKYDGYYLDTPDFKTKRIQFVKGEFYAKGVLAKDDEHAFTFESDLFVWSSNKENKYNEFYLNYDPEKVNLKICSGVESGLPISLFEFEDKKILKYAEGAVFQGVKENGQIQFDELLNHRKSPKGKWIEDFKCDFNQILESVNVKEKEYKALVKKEAIEKAKKLVKQKIEYNKSLCHFPNGQLNQCIWKFVVENKTKNCVRFKCNGEGQWSEATRVNDKLLYRCQEKTTAQACDY